MHINENYILKTVGDNNMIIPLQDGGMDYSKVYNINKVGAFIFSALENGDDFDTILDKMVKKYDADIEVLKKDLTDFINELIKRNIVID